MAIESIRDQYDVLIVGAGPAGMSAALVCANAGLATVVFDEQPTPGGQIYRSIDASPHRRGTLLGADYWRGMLLVEQFRASGAQYVPNAAVWSLTRDLQVGVATRGGAQLVRARRIIVCTGAMERPFPIAGWTLPGVMTIGAAQILLKTSALTAQGRVVLAGCGPLLWLLAWQYLNAGCRIDLILDTTASENRTRSLRHLPAFMFSPYLMKGLRLMRAVRARVKVISNITALRAIGHDRIEGIAYRVGSSAEAEVAVDTLLLHQGIVPNVNLAMSAGVAHQWDDDQLCFAPTLGGNGDTSLDNVAIAGDGAGIAGAEIASQRGVLAGIAAVRALGGSARVDEGEAHRVIGQYERGRKFLDVRYQAAQAFRIPAGDTVVCRCEEVSAAQITQTVRLGCPGPNQMKAFLRCGMGPCQGRLCGVTVTELIASIRGLSPQAIGYYRLRPPVKPITVAELASLPKTPEDVKAVIRT